MVDPYYDKKDEAKFAAQEAALAAPKLPVRSSKSNNTSMELTTTTTTSTTNDMGKRLIFVVTAQFAFNLIVEL